MSALCPLVPERGIYSASASARPGHRNYSNAFADVTLKRHECRAPFARSKDYCIVLCACVSPQQSRSSENFLLNHKLRYDDLVNQIRTQNFVESGPQFLLELISEARFVDIVQSLA